MFKKMTPKIASEHVQNTFYLIDDLISIALTSLILSLESVLKRACYFVSYIQQKNNGQNPESDKLYFSWLNFEHEILTHTLSVVLIVDFVLFK